MQEALGFSKEPRRARKNLPHGHVNREAANIDITIRQIPEIRVESRLPKHCARVVAEAGEVPPAGTPRAPEPPGKPEKTLSQVFRELSRTHFRDEQQQPAPEAMSLAKSLRPAF